MTLVFSSLGAFFVWSKALHPLHSSLPPMWHCFGRRGWWLNGHSICGGGRKVANKQLVVTSVALRWFGCGWCQLPNLATTERRRERETGTRCMGLSACLYEAVVRASQSVMRRVGMGLLATRRASLKNLSKPTRSRTLLGVGLVESGLVSGSLTQSRSIDWGRRGCVSHEPNGILRGSTVCKTIETVDGNQSLAWKLSNPFLA